MRLVTFNRISLDRGDFQEKAADTGLGLIQIGVGQTAAVRKISSGGHVFIEKVYPEYARVAAVALFSFALIGSRRVTCSKSYWQAFNLYRIELKEKRPQLSCPNTPKDKAATTIQKHFRGYLARKPLLPSHLYPQYLAQFKQTWGMPYAKTGHTRVFLPQQMP